MLTLILWGCPLALSESLFLQKLEYLQWMCFHTGEMLWVSFFWLKLGIYRLGYSQSCSQITCYDRFYCSKPLFFCCKYFIGMKQLGPRKPMVAVVCCDQQWTCFLCSLVPRGSWRRGLKAPGTSCLHFSSSTSWSNGRAWSHPTWGLGKRHLGLGSRTAGSNWQREGTTWWRLDRWGCWISLWMSGHVEFGKGRKSNQSSCWCIPTGVSPLLLVPGCAQKNPLAAGFLWSNSDTLWVHFLLCSRWKCLFPPPPPLPVWKAVVGIQAASLAICSAHPWPWQHQSWWMTELLIKQGAKGCVEIQLAGSDYWEIVL